MADPSPRKMQQQQRGIQKVGRLSTAIRERGGEGEEGEGEEGEGEEGEGKREKEEEKEKEKEQEQEKEEDKVVTEPKDLSRWCRIQDWIPNRLLNQVSIFPATSSNPSSSATFRASCRTGAHWKILARTAAQ